MCSCVDILYVKMANTNRNCTTVCTFNCRSLKSSTNEIIELCNMSDFVFLQEHWLLPTELDCLNNLHNDFCATGHSAVELSQGILIGRPYGGTAILFRKNLMSYITLVETHDDRLTALIFQSTMGSVLLVSVYMPTDYGDPDCIDNFTDTCARISALYNECDVKCSMRLLLVISIAVSDLDITILSCSWQ